MKIKHNLTITLKSLPHIIDAVSEEHNTADTGQDSDKTDTAITAFSFDKSRFKSVFKYKLIITLTSTVQFLLRKENQQQWKYNQECKW